VSSKHSNDRETQASCLQLSAERRVRLMGQCQSDRVKADRLLATALSALTGELHPLAIQAPSGTLNMVTRRGALHLWTQ